MQLIRMVLLLTGLLMVVAPRACTRKGSRGDQAAEKKIRTMGGVADSGSHHLAGNGYDMVGFWINGLLLKEKIFTECLEWVIVHSNEKNGGFSYVL